MRERKEEREKREAEYYYSHKLPGSTCVPGGKALTEQVTCTVEAAGSVRDPRTLGFCSLDIGPNTTPAEESSRKAEI